MLTVSNIGLRYGDKKLFEEVNLKFTPGNCYGVIGANGAGKSTFLKILAGEIEPNTGHVSYPKDIRMSVLKQDHYQYDELPVLETVIRGNERLFEIDITLPAIVASLLPSSSSLIVLNANSGVSEIVSTSSSINS